LGEDACQTQKQLAERLNIAQQTISDHLKTMRKILKEGKWVPHQLNERQMENRSHQ
jgi:predicted transcriptional regulator